MSCLPFPTVTRFSPAPAAGEAVVAPAVPAAARQGRWAVVALVAAIFLWGANWPVMKVGLAHVTPLWFSALRFAAGAACLFLLQAAQGRLHLPRRADLPVIASIGLLQMTAFTALGMEAMTVLPAGRSAILSYTTPVWVAPAAILLFGEKATPRGLAGIALGLAGIVVLVNPLSIPWHVPGVLGANAMLLLAAGCWAACILHLRVHPVSAYAVAPWQMLLAATGLALAGQIWEGPFTGDGSTGFWEALAFVGPVATAFCFVAVNAASTRLPATTMSMAMLGVPLAGLALSVAVLGERVDAALAIGTACIAGGMLVSLRQKD
ncbi:DMT family transporter [Pararoseomonas indoligenes]|uniref:DMT family transporter n=1 Tax=Roseomonas indoligenes TaxID=2820811 RepID=A0A940S7J4_9PROT|nr:DMT family transporter [Pararoseomonas indoligenes]MBP0495119.1 DMT family transporter [Pararoseomonas indoligenes]